MAFPGDYERKVECPVNSAAVNGSGDLTDFVNLVTLSNVPSDMMDAGSISCLNGGGDIRAGNEDGSVQYPLHVVRCVTNATAGSRQLELHVQLTVNGTSGGSFWLFYKNAGDSQPAANSTYGSENVYDSDFILVSHDGGFTNSTSNSNPTEQGTVGTATGARTNSDAADFGTHANNLGFTLGISNAASFTLESEAYLEGSLSDNLGVILGVTNGGFTSYVSFFIDDSDSQIGGYNTNSFDYVASGWSPTINTWHQMALRWDGTTDAHIITDGTVRVDDTTVNTPDTGKTTLTIGYVGDSSQNHEGLQGEVRYSDVARSEEWIITTQDMLGDPASYITAQTSESTAGGGGVTIPVFNQHYRNQGMM